MSRRPLRSALFAAIALLASAPAVAATWVVPVQGSRELTLSIPPVQTPSSNLGSVAQSLGDVVRHDLDLTGYYAMIAATADGGGVEPGSFDLASIKARGAVATARIRVVPAGVDGCGASAGGFCADVYVYDVLGQAKIVGKRVAADSGEVRTAAHEVASQIHLALVGEPGFFHGQLAAVRAGPGNTKEIVLVDVDGENQRAVTRNASVNLSPGWSPDGTRLAWTSFRRGTPLAYLKDLRTGGVRSLAGKGDTGLSPSFSPDGRYVAVARTIDSETDIWLLDARTGAPVRQLTTGGGIDISPCFTPDGRRVVFSSERGGTPSIYAVAVDGGTPVRVTPFGGRLTDPVVSPDGRRVAFVVQHGSFDVWVSNLDGTGLVHITSGQGDNEDPTWSPDGHYLAFTSTRRGRSELWIATDNGRYQAPLTQSGGWSQPSWKP
jgi:TolB protein